MPGQAAGLGTAAPVSTPAADHTAQKTLTGIGVTEGPVDEGKSRGTKAEPAFEKA